MTTIFDQADELMRGVGDERSRKRGSNENAEEAS